METRTRRAGVVVPSGNATVEPEFQQLLSHWGAVYAARLPVFPDRDLRQRLEGYNDSARSVIEGFGRLELDAVVIACSGGHYLQGPEADREFCLGLSHRLGVRVVSVTQAIVECFRAYGLTGMTLVSPYAPWLTELSVAYWEAAGLRVDGVVSVESAKGFSPYDVTTDDLVRQVRDARLPGNGPLLFTGTGMPTLGALRTLREDHRTLLTSNLCGAWWAVNAGGGWSEEAFEDWPVPGVATGRPARPVLLQETSLGTAESA
ncbi:arylmalonate decarboxylase [Streptomyces blastmyceticus]|uniref:Arylmalonate decarboxylase n=1 Tax=Streptomyces blastmyceticus TaxID=68180 RepID=A0ABP3G8R6_9ACTN